MSRTSAMSQDIVYDKEDYMWECGCNCQPESKREGGKQLVGKLQRDLMGSFYWSGNCCMDYCFWIMNWHPLLGICFSHAAHPWSKLDRIATLVVSVCLSMPPSVLVVHMLVVAKKSMGLIPTSAPIIATTFGPITGAYNPMMISTTGVLSEVEQAKGMSEFLLVFLFVTLPVMIWEILMYWLSVGDACCKGRGCICDTISRIFGCCKTACFCFSLWFSLTVLCISLGLMSMTEAPWLDLLRPLAMSRLQSWVLWFPIYTFLPCFGFLWTWFGEKDVLGDSRASDSDFSESDVEE
jgi:hypothetical protein